MGRGRGGGGGGVVPRQKIGWGVPLSHKTHSC